MKTARRDDLKKEFPYFVCDDRFDESKIVREDIDSEMLAIQEEFLQRIANGEFDKKA